MNYTKENLIGVKFKHRAQRNTTYTIAPYNTDSLLEEGLLAIEWINSDGIFKRTTYHISNIAKHLSSGIWIKVIDNET